MNKKTFMKIAFGVRECDDYCMFKLIAWDYMGSHRFNNARLPSSALRMEHHVIRMRIVYAWLGRYALKPWSGFVGRWWQCWERTTCEPQINKTLLESCIRRSERISWDYWEHRLYALGLEKLPICLEGTVQRTYQRVHCDTLSSSRTGPLDLACFLRNGGNSQ
jgi:hypothetical protein